MGEDRKTRRGRGRLSSIDTLPDEAQPDVEWALEELRERKLPQTEILDAFNTRLRKRGIEPVSKSAFSRYAVRKAIQFRQLDEARRISGELVAALGADGADDLTIAVGEMLKLATMQILERGANDPLDIMSLARAVQAATSAQKTSAEHRRRIEQRMAEKIDSAVEQVAKVKGITAETAEAIKAQILGVKAA